MRSLAILVLAAALPLAACKIPIGPWEKSDTTSDEAQQDRLSCELAARKVLQQDSRITQDINSASQSTSAYGLPLTGGGGSTLAQNMNQYNYEQQRRNLVADCMEGRGYQVSQ
jgi:predicted lipoprotein